jgi:hypothetical protein
MSGILDRATAHFREQVSADMKSVFVPEWNSKIWFKKTVSLREQSRLIELSTQGKTVEAVVESLIVKSRNEDDTKMFTMADKVTLMNETDPNVLIRVVSEINEATNPDLDLEKVEKN